MSSTPIQEHQIIKVNINDVKIDPTNPNYMTEDQMNGLRLSMKEFGYLDPIVIDQNNVIADGEHRLLVYKEAGKTTIDAYRVNMTDTKRRLLRQIMNKLRGQHEPQKDYNEFIKIMESTEKQNQDLMNALNINRDGLSELSALLSVNSANQGLIDSMEADRTQDGSPQEHHAESFLYGNIKQITAYFNNENYEAIMVKIKEMMDVMGLDNHTDLIWTLVNWCYDQSRFYEIKGQKTDKPKHTKEQLTYQD